MTQTGRYHGGLVFVGGQEGVLDRLGRIVTATLEDYGHPVERQSVLDAAHIRVVTSRYMVKLELQDMRGARDMQSDVVVGLNAQRRTRMDQQARRLVVELHPVAAGQEDTEVSELMLVVMLYRMVDAVAVSQIEWLSPDTILTVEQFLGAFTNVSPRRVRGAQEVLPPQADPFAPVDETEPGLARQYDAILGRSHAQAAHGLVDLSEEEAVALAFRYSPRHDDISGAIPHDEADSDVRRLATWGMTGMLAFLSAPVAASMAAVNLARGEDFRLNSHVLSLTCLLVVLQSSGALASVVSHLPL